MRYFSNILLLLIAMIASVSASAADVDPNDFIIKRGRGSAYQTVVSGDSIEPFYYEYSKGVKIDHVYVPDAIFTVNHDKTNRKIYLTGVTGGPTRTYEIRMFGLVTNDSLDNYRISRPGKLTVLRPYLDYKSENTKFELTVDDILDTIKVDYTKFTYSVWTSDLPYGMELIRKEDHCELVSTETLPSGSYSFTLYGADSLYFSKDSVIVTDAIPGKGSAQDTMKFHPKYYCDSLEFTINVYEGGLMKIGTGGTKQIVGIGDSIETFGFEWNAPGQLITEPMPKGLEMLIDSSKQDIWIQGAPTELGTHNFEIGYKVSNSKQFTYFEIQVAVVREFRPIIENMDESTASQILSVGDMIDDIVLSYYNTDSVWVEGLPEGIKSDINSEDEQITLYGVMQESGLFNVKVHARNEKYEAVYNISLSTSDKTGEATGIDDVMSDEIGNSIVYDMLGRRVSPEKMGNKSVFTIKKKIVIRK